MSQGAPAATNPTNVYAPQQFVSYTNGTNSPGGTLNASNNSKGNLHGAQNLN